MIFSSLVGVRLEGIRTWSATQLDPASEACDVIDETVFLVVFAAGASFEVLVLCLRLVGCAVKCVVPIWALSSLRNQGKIDDFHIFINISAGIYSSVLRNIPFERERNWLYKNIHCSPCINSFLKKIQKWKNLHSWCKENQDGRHLVQNKVSLQGMFKNESVALFLGQLQVKFPWKEANIAFFRYYF